MRDVKTQGFAWTSWAGWCVAFAVAGSGCLPPPANIARGVEVYETCVPCHGPDALGNVALGVPSIAGMESWYLDAQLKKFRAGTRGVHPDDAEGLRMRPMALSLPLDADTTAVAGYLTTLHAKPPVASVTGGDARRGMEIYSRCATCHGANGEGNQALSAPSLANKEPWYLLGQLKKFKAGQRGANPADVYGAMMRAQAMQLPDEQAMRDVLTHVQVLARP